MGPFVLTYVIVMVIMMAVAGFTFIDANFKERKIASRMMLIAPMWPLMAPVFLIKAYRWFWKRADWKGVEEDEEYEKERGRGRW